MNLSNITFQNSNLLLFNSNKRNIINSLNSLSSIKFTENKFTEDDVSIIFFNYKSYIRDFKLNSLLGLKEEKIPEYLIIDLNLLINRQQNLLVLIKYFIRNIVDLNFESGFPCYKIIFLNRTSSSSSSNHIYHPGSESIDLILNIDNEILNIIKSRN